MEKPARRVDFCPNSVTMAHLEPEESPQHRAARDAKRARAFVDRERRTITLHLGSADEDAAWRRHSVQDRRSRLLSLFESALAEFGPEFVTTAPVDLQRVVVGRTAA